MKKELDVIKLEDRPCKCGGKEFKVKRGHKTYTSEKEGWMFDILLCTSCQRVYKDKVLPFEDKKENGRANRKPTRKN